MQPDGRTVKAPLVSAGDLAKRWSMSKDAVLDLYHRGAIPAEIAEGKVYRFDSEKVESILAERAKARQRAART